MIKNIITKYDKTVRPAWTINDVFNHRARFVKQSCCLGHYADFDFTVEPYPGEISVVFENRAELNQTFSGSGDSAEWFVRFVDVIYTSIGQVLDEFYDNAKPIIGVKITLTNLIMHEIDSREMSFKIATHIGLKEVFTEDNLVQIECWQEENSI